MSEIRDLDWSQQWSSRISLAQARPAMFVADQSLGHLYAIGEPLRLVWEAEAFYKPEMATVTVSPSQYQVVCNTGPLKRSIARLVQWSNAETVIEAAAEAMLKVRIDRRYLWQKKFKEATGPTLFSPMMPLYLADLFSIAIKTTSGYWCQSFKDGWPIAPPFLIDIKCRVGILVVGSLSDTHFTGLPFSESSVAYYLQERFNQLINIEWLYSDTLMDNVSLTPDNIMQTLAQY